jgi:hypothetical protein
MNQVEPLINSQSQPLCHPALSDGMEAFGFTSLAELLQQLYPAEEDDDDDDGPVLYYWN